MFLFWPRLHKWCHSSCFTLDRWRKTPESGVLESLNTEQPQFSALCDSVLVLMRAIWDFTFSLTFWCFNLIKSRVSVLAVSKNEKKTSVFPLCSVHIMYFPLWECFETHNQLAEHFAGEITLLRDRDLSLCGDLTPQVHRDITGRSSLTVYKVLL